MRQLLKTLFFFLLVTQICFAQWVQLGLADRHIREIAVGSTGLFAVTSENGSVFRTTDGGASWFQILDSLGTHVAVAPNGTTFMAVGDSLYQSTDGGTSWINLHMLEQINVGMSRLNIYCVAVGPNGNIFSGCFARHVDIGGTGGDAYGVVNAISTDNGTTWNWGGVWGGEAYSFREHSVITSGYWRAVTTGRFVQSLSFDDGLRWSSLEYDEFFFPPFIWCANGNIIGNGISHVWGWLWVLALSKDTCASLMKISDISPSALLALPQGRVLVGTDSTGICLFSDNGDSLGTLNEGLSDFHVHAFAMDSKGSYAYVGTDDGVWRRPVSQLIVSVKPLTSRLPTEFLLSNNFPNPFNPSTKIKYSVPQPSNVVIKVFDVLGNEIETIVNEVKPAGTYGVTWYAADLPSGVYFYQLRTGEFIDTKKMILLK
jgi:hypothetical protein